MEKVLLKVCPACGLTVPTTSRYVEGGYRFENDFRFCPYCGSSLDQKEHSPQKDLAAGNQKTLEGIINVA